MLGIQMQFPIPEAGILISFAFGLANFCSHSSQWNSLTGRIPPLFKLSVSKANFDFYFFFFLL
jgi:hypothetical protein